MPPEEKWFGRQGKARQLQMNEEDSEKLGTEIKSLFKEMDERLDSESPSKKIIAATVVSLFVVYFLVINLWIK